MSEIGGSGLGPQFSNLYYATAKRSVASTLTRWGAQVMCDALSNELNEFWPAIRPQESEAVTRT